MKTHIPSPSAPVLESTMLRRALFALPLFAAACDPYARPADFYGTADKPLWDSNVVTVGDAVYARLPAGERLVRIQSDGTLSTVDLAGASPDRMVATPDGEALLVFASWQACEDADNTIESPDECPEDDLVTRRELARVVGDKRLDAFNVPAHLNALTFTEDGRTAVAYLDYTEQMAIEVDGLIDLGEVMFLPLDGASPARSVSVGFSPEKILFSTDSAGLNDKAVIFSRSEVVVVELGTLDVVVTYPLVLDADQVVDPADAVLTEDGRVALVTIQGSSDLYELDLEKHSIDLEELDDSPVAMVNATLPEFDDGDDLPVTLIAYARKAEVEVLDQNALELREPLLLEEPVSDILATPDAAVMYNRNSDSVKDVYHINLGSYAITEYRVANPIDELRLSPEQAYAVATLRPEIASNNALDAYQDSRWGLAVIDLLNQEETSLVLEAEPIGLALVERDEATYALVLMQGLEHLIQVNLAEPTFFSEVELAAPPLGIGQLASGQFYVTHDAALGLVSFLDPSTGDLTAAGGFATPGLFHESTLLNR
ncbi:MAG TPA: hypothetical protein DFR83_20140 [Deltaproteobacteria bacterium]|nr:hypothetical protein [Deltaproteobacteria bacterium]